MSLVQIKAYVNKIILEEDNNKLFEYLYIISSEERKIVLNILLELKKNAQEKQLSKIKKILKVIEYIASEKNIATSYYLEKEFKNEYFEVIKILEICLKKDKLITTEVILKLNENQAKIANCYFKKKKILEEKYLDKKDLKKIEINISALGLHIKSLKDNKQKDKYYMDKNKEKTLRSIMNISERKESKKYYIKKNSLIIVDYDNITPTKSDIEKISNGVTVILVCHKKKQEYLIRSLNIKGKVKVINVNSNIKQSVDMKIYSILSKAQILEIKNKFVISRDKGFDCYCKINEIEYKRLTSLKGVYVDEEDISDLREIDSEKFSNDNLYESVKNKLIIKS